MKIKREELLSVLARLKPAIAKNDIVEQFAHVWFDGEHASACDDALGIIIPFETDFQGGLRGTVLTNYLNASRADEVELTGREEVLKISAGRAKLELSLLPLDRRDWLFEEVTASEEFDVTAAFLEALRRVSIVNSPDFARMETMGVTIVTKKQELDFYTTDTKTIAVMSCPIPKNYDVPVGERIILPYRFIEQLEDEYLLAVSTDHAIAFGPGIAIYTKMIQSKNPLDFEAVIDRSAPEVAEMYFTIPDEFVDSLDRACSILKGDTPKLQITVVAASISLFVEDNPKFSYGEFNETIPIMGFNSGTTMIDPKLLRRGLGSCDRMAVTPDAVVVDDEYGFQYLVSVRTA